MSLALIPSAEENGAINFLAHLYLAAPTDASRVGNLLGDFVKGTPESLRDQYPDEVIHGILMHRALDRFTDAHAAFREARSLLTPPRRRFAGIIVDIFFDHFLALHWQTFSSTPLMQFIEEMYRTLERHPEWLHHDLHEILPRMRKENWLDSYASFAGLELTFHRIAHRSPRLQAISGSLEDLTTHYHSLERTFHQFFPEAQQESDTLNRASLLPWQ